MICIILIIVEKQTRVGWRRCSRYAHHSVYILRPEGAFAW
jgi:hypothetical protein